MVSGGRLAFRGGGEERRRISVDTLSVFCIASVSFFILLDTGSVFDLDLDLR